jgi:DNA-binding NarL/FixJ family response regulator
MLKVLLVDDHVIVRVGLRRILREAFQDVSIGEAADGDEALRAVQAQSWDIVVLDITMPGLSGIETLYRLKRQYPRLRVLMLSMHAGLQYITRSLKGGAAGYLSKESAAEELVTAIETVLSGGTYISRALSEQVQSSVTR